MNAVCSAVPVDEVEQLSRELLAAARGTASDALLARIVAAQRSGRSCLPLHLGLDGGGFSALMQRHFPGCLFWLALHSGHERAWQCGNARQQLLEMRRDEWRELRALLLQGRRGDDMAEVWLADIVAAGCLGGDHLWRDLGLRSRAQLSELLHGHFPGVAQRNQRDMKWKKFFYKQLCETGGDYVCRAPSCDQCAAYAQCFGPES